MAERDIGSSESVDSVGSMVIEWHVRWGRCNFSPAAAGALSTLR